MCEPRGCYSGDQGGDFGKRGGAEQHGDKAPGGEIVLSDGSVGETVQAW